MKTIKLHCDKCGYQEEITTNSEAYFNKELFFNPPSTSLGEIWEDFIIDEEIIKKIDDLMVNKQAMLDIDKVSHKLYYSSKEEKIYCLLYFKLLYCDKNGNVKHYTPKYKDSEGNLLKLLTSKKVNVKCPKCGSKITL